MPPIPVDLTMSTVAAMVSQVYPSVEVQSVAPLAGGKINAVFEITFTKLPAKLVLKIYADTYQWKMENVTLWLWRPLSVARKARIIRLQTIMKERLSV